MPRTRKTKQRKKGRMEAVAKGEQRKEDEATMVAWPHLADFGEGDTRAAAVQQVQDALRDAVAARGMSFPPDSDAEDDEDIAGKWGNAIDKALTPEPEGSDGVLPRALRPARTPRLALNRAGTLRRPRSRVVESDVEDDYDLDHAPDVALVKLAKRADRKPSIRAKVRLNLRRLIKYGEFQHDIDELEDSLYKYERGDRLRQKDYEIIMTAAPGRVNRVPRPRCLPPTISTRPEQASMEASLRADILNIGGRAFATGPFFERLGAFATTLQRDIHIHRKPLFHATRSAKLGGTMAKSGQFKGYGAAAAFWKARPNNCEISMALAVPWMMPPAGTTWEDFRGSEFHAVLFVLIHAPPGPGSTSAGKALLIGDVNTSGEQHDDLLPRVKTLLTNAPTHRFVNLARTECNDRGICLTLALEWMLELVIRGVEYKRDEDGKVAQVTGFCPSL
ncbi:hypothetical protein B0H14DRAFT_3880451 [Mycena olivaceomarginata]|nr:hypothetical protein B0H14DRAFT_3880451 [Mycena olivaceomarginata]